MSAIPAVHPARRRAHSLVLLVCAAFLMSGSDAALQEQPAGTAAHGLEFELPGTTLMRVQRIVARANPALASRDHARIAAAVVRFSRHYGLDPDLVTAIVLVESDARPWAHSARGAVGLMQVMPHMMGPLNLAGNAATIESNIEAGCHILAHNIERLGEERGISAYFWGSRIRDAGYLEKVLRERERVRGSHTS